MKQKMKKALLLSVILSAFVFVSQSYALKINIDPPRVEVSVKPGDEKSGFIVVQNKDESGTMHIKAYVQDLVYLPDGSNDFLPVGSTPWTLGDNIKIGPTEFDVQAGRQEMIRYVVTAPKDMKGGRYGVIFFESAVPPSEIQKVGANINLRIGTVMLLTAQNTEIYKVKLKEITVKTPEKKGEPLVVLANVFNEGNVIARPSGTVKLIDKDKVVVAEFPINKEKGGVLPNTNRTYKTDYRGELKPGAYFAQVVLDYGGDSLLGGQKKIEIK